MWRWKRPGKWHLFIFALAVLLGGLAVLGGIAWSKSAIYAAAKGRVFTDAEAVPACRVGLVLGCAKELSNGRANLYFERRMDAAAELYATNRVEYLIVSGDNSRMDYDESTDMKDALVARGIPAEKIICDYAGFSTLDSVVRAQAIFQQDRFVVVSQDFHARRAIYIGQQHGLEVYAYTARDVHGTGGLRTQLREHLARVKTVLDVKLLGREPRFYGEVIAVRDQEQAG